MRSRAHAIALRSGGAFIMFLKVLEVGLKFAMIFIPIIAVCFTIAIVIAIVGIAESATMVGHSSITNTLADDLHAWVTKMVVWTGIEDICE